MAVTITLIDRDEGNPDSGSGDDGYTGAGKVNTSLTNLKTAVDKVLDVPEDRVIGRVSTGTGDPEFLTAAQLRTLLDVPGNSSAFKQAHIDHGTKGSNFSHDVSAYKTGYVNVNGAITITLTEPSGSDTCSYSGVLFVRMNTTTTGPVASIGGSLNHEVVKGDPPATSGDNAILVYHYFRDGDGGEHGWAEWVLE